MGVIRTFVAIQVADRVVNNLTRVIERLARTGAEFKWVEPENLHITLNFAGDIPERDTPDFCREVKEAVAEFSSFDVSLQGVSGFPDASNPKTLWVGVDQGAEEIDAIYQNIEPVVQRWGSHRSRQAFVPHLTLGRLQHRGQANEELLSEIHRLRNHDGGVCVVNKVTVFSSFLEKSGPTYTPMATIRI